jgi:hypothetical protein
MATTSTSPAGMKDQSKRSGQAAEFTAILPLKPGGAQRMRERLKNYTAEDAAALDKVGTVHDLRLVIFDNDTRLLFATTYDGSWEQYIKDFATLVPDHIDKEVQDCEGWPGVRSPEVWAYLARYQIPAMVFYSAYPEVSVRDVRKAVKTKKAFDALLDTASS